MSLPNTRTFALAVAFFAAATIALACGDDDGTGGVVDDSIRREQVSAGDLTFDLRVAGPDGGQTVILLHGFPENSYQWRDQLTALARAGYRAIAPDQRGYSPGARPADVEDYSIVFMIQDTLAIADAYQADTFHLVGHDWGAGVAWGVAGLAPDRVDTLTILSIPHPDAFNADLADPNSCQFQASGYFDVFAAAGAADLFLDNDASFLRSLFTGIDDDAVAEYVGALEEPAAMRAALYWYTANVSDRSFALPALGPIVVPTLFLWSDGDVAICRDTAEKTGRFVDAPYDFVILEGVDHWITDRAPADVNRHLLEHIS